MRAPIAFLLAASLLPAQVYSPKVLRQGQPDPTNLKALAAGIYSAYNAQGPRERAEAIWRFFLTDGRFVKPGFFYHIAGWAYEEPQGEVLDPLKLLNSYGFGLCYHLAPLLADVYKAGGFEDARVWFLTGHTVAEVFYDGAYHHFDSDMLGYNTTGQGTATDRQVASVRQLEQDPNIILNMLNGPHPDPWYPADVRANAIPGLAELFTTTNDNFVYPFQRSPQSHSMDFTLRPGERLIRYYEPEAPNLYYLPYKFTGAGWQEFPQEIAQYDIRTANGPRSQKDARLWATGRLEYRPPTPAELTTVYPVNSPYVIIDAQFQIEANLPTAQDTLTLETSTDQGRTWLPAAELKGPHQGPYKAEPAVLTRSAHGRRTAVSGLYHYQLRLRRTANARITQPLIITRFQLNPRTLPELQPGPNQLTYTAAAPALRTPIPATLESAQTTKNVRLVANAGQGYFTPADPTAPAELLFRIAANRLTAVEAGGQFLDLANGWAPDKLTAETRRVPPLPNTNAEATLAWSTSPNGPFQPLWTYNPKPTWRDSDPIIRTLPWHEVDRRLDLPKPSDIYIRYQFKSLALDALRLTAITTPPAGESPIQITHQWKENGVAKSATRTQPAGARAATYAVNIPAGAKVKNTALIFEAR
jgi:hypothetical protein